MSLTPLVMKYGVFAGNQHLNDCIYECFESLLEEDVRAFVKNFRTQDKEQALHTFRELVLGTFLARQSPHPRYSEKLLGKTPDWCLHADANQVVGIVELLNFHQASIVEKSMLDTLGKSETWVDWVPSNSERLYQKLLQKAQAYDSEIAAIGVPYVVAIFGTFTAAVETDELNDALFNDHDGGVFHQAPSLSGVLFFEESAGRYPFRYIANPIATRPINFASGVV
jgi:hypothetical protein